MSRRVPGSRDAFRRAREASRDAAGFILHPRRSVVPADTTDGIVVTLGEKAIPSKIISPNWKPSQIVSTLLRPRRFSDARYCRWQAVVGLKSPLLKCQGKLHILRRPKPRIQSKMPVATDKLDRILEVLGRATEANRKTPGLRGNVVELTKENCGDVMIT